MRILSIMSNSFRAFRAVLMRLWRREPTQLILIITAILFGCMLLIGWSTLSRPELAIPEAPVYWSAVKVFSDPTVAPGSSDQRLCDTPDTLYPTGTGTWYDLCPANNGLFVSVLAADHTLLRGPSSLGESFSACSGAVLSSHDLVVLCHTSSALTLHVVDTIGRPHTPIAISGRADLSGLAVDPSGRLHVGWLDPQAGSIWTVHYATYSGDSTVLDSGAALPADNIIGVIHVSADHLLGDFALGIDAHTVYAIWADSSAPYGPGSDVPGVIYALTFPLDKPNNVQQITIAQNMQSWNVPLVISDHTLALPLAAASKDNAPAVAFLVNGKTARIDVFSSPLTELFRGPYLTKQADGSLSLQWSVWTADQREISYVSTTRSFP